MKIYKKGITLVGLGIALVVMLILGTAITISAIGSINNAKMLTFALEISNIQESVTNYYNESNKENYPIKNNGTIDTSSLGGNLETQFSSETVVDSKILLYEIDMDLIGIKDTEYGNNTTVLDKYVVSEETGRVYYLEGLKVGSKKYYTLTEDLIKIANSSKTSPEDNVVNPDSSVPTITTGGFTVNNKQDGKGKDIYLININVSDTDNNLKIVKYETDKIDQENAKEYFSSYGRTLNDNIIETKEGAYITIYAEDSSGNWSIRQEGIPLIPKGFYYIGGSTPTGVVISDNVADSNKGTAIDGSVVSEKLLGNQFVWVPVNNIHEFTINEGYSNTTLQVYISGGHANEPCSKIPELTALNDTTREYAEYAAMKSSVEKYDGFYIARYEAGDGSVSLARTTTTTGAHTVVSKKDAWVYNYVGWGKSMINVEEYVISDDGTTNLGTGAVKLSRKMYTESGSVVSTLCYGVQWDAAIRFISNTYLDYEKNSIGKGWYSENYGSLNPDHKTRVGCDKFRKQIE